MDVLILLLVLFASFIGTVTGFGTSTILVPVLSFNFPFSEVLMFVGVIHWFGNIWKMYFFRKGASLALLGSFGVFGLIFSFIGAEITSTMPHLFSSKLLGIFLVCYCLFVFKNPTAQLTNTFIHAAFGGALSGIASGLFGVGGAIRSGFLTAFNLKKSTYLFTSGFMGLVIDSSRLVGYWKNGADITTFGMALLIGGIPISLFGAWLAKQLVHKIPEKVFRQGVLIGLLLIGIYYIVQ